MENMWKLQKLPMYLGIKNQYHIIDYKGSAYLNISIINREDRYNILDKIMCQFPKSISAWRALFHTHKLYKIFI